MCACVCVRVCVCVMCEYVSSMLCKGNFCVEGDTHPHITMALYDYLEGQKHVMSSDGVAAYFFGRNYILQ